MEAGVGHIFLAVNWAALYAFPIARKTWPGVNIKASAQDITVKRPYLEKIVRRGIWGQAGQDGPRLFFRLRGHVTPRAASLRHGWENW